MDGWRRRICSSSSRWVVVWRKKTNVKKARSIYCWSSSSRCLCAKNVRKCRQWRTLCVCCGRWWDPDFPDPDCSSFFVFHESSQTGKVSGLSNITVLLYSYSFEIIIMNCTYLSLSFPSLIYFIWQQGAKKKKVSAYFGATQKNTQKTEGWKNILHFFLNFLSSHSKIPSTLHTQSVLQSTNFNMETDSTGAATKVREECEWQRDGTNWECIDEEGYGCG